MKAYRVYHYDAMSDETVMKPYFVTEDEKTLLESSKSNPFYFEPFNIEAADFQFNEAERPEGFRNYLDTLGKMLTASGTASR